MKRKGFILILLLLSLPVITFKNFDGHGLFEGERVLFVNSGFVASAAGSFDGADNGLAEGPDFNHNNFSLRSWKTNVVQKALFSWDIAASLFEVSPEMLPMTSASLDSVEVDLSQVSDLQELAGRLGRTFGPDSTSFFRILNSESYLATFNTDPCRLQAYLLPHKVAMPATTGPYTFVQKVLGDFNKYWNGAKLKRAKSLGLSPEEVIILASIVDGETWECDEMPKIAGLYVNRLKLGMRLQADPTVIFACKQQDPDLEITRVKGEHLAVESPFNTYRHKGLPPGPISLPDFECIDAVLNAAQHDYLYMVANPDSFGYHTFSTTLEEHRIHRDKYIAWLEKRESERADSLVIPAFIGGSDELTEYDSLLVIN